jgi:hypothetical protein
VLNTAAAIATIIGAIAAVAAVYYARAQSHAARTQPATEDADVTNQEPEVTAAPAPDASPANRASWRERCLVLGPLGLCTPVIIYLQFYRTIMVTFGPWHVMLFAAAIGMAATAPAWKRNPAWVLAIEFNLAWFLWRAFVLVASVDHVPIVFGFDPHAYYIAITAIGAAGNAAILIWDLKSSVRPADPLLRVFLTAMTAGFLVQSFGVSKLSLPTQRIGAEILFAALLVSLYGPLLVLARRKQTRVP